MIGLDLREIGSMLGLKLYVDVSELQQSERDERAEEVTQRLRKMAGVPDPKPKYELADNRDNEQLHWIEGDKNGKQINILHWAGCKDRCEAYVYLEEHQDLDIRRGRDYTLKKVNGTWVLEEMKKNANATTKS